MNAFVAVRCFALLHCWLQTETYAKTSEYKQFYPCAVTCNRELHTASSDRSVRLISLQLPEGATYETGDHLAVEAANLPEEVEKLANALKLPLNTRFSLRSVQVALDPPAWAKSPISVRTAFTYFFDIMSPLSSEGLELLAASAQDPGAKRAAESTLPSASAQMPLTLLWLRRAAEGDLTPCHRFGCIPNRRG